MTSVSTQGGRNVVGRYTQTVLGQLDRLFGRGTVAGLSEATLLERFVAGRDETALAALVAMHGPMVLGVCRRLLYDEHDVEDAFQATFLVLVRRAGAIRDGDRIGPWLHGVAHRIAVRARTNSARRLVRQRTGEALVREAPAPPSSDVALSELRTVLDDELSRLPESMRVPLVLCYLEGLTHDEAAQRLGWPVGTVRSRMARARDQLRRRLTRRGFPGDEATLTAMLSSQPISSTLLDATVSASLGYASRNAASAVTSATAAALAQGVLNAMMIAKWKFLGAAAMACVVAAAGVQTYGFQKGDVRETTTLDKPIAKQSDQAATLLRAIDAIQAELAESARRNGELQKQIQDLRAELETLRTATPGSSKEARAVEPPAAKQGTVVAGSDDKLAPPNNAPFVRIGPDLLLAISPQGDRVVAYDTATKKRKSVRLSEDKTTPLEVMPMHGPGGPVALVLRGPKITRVAVFDMQDRTWYPVDLREPVVEAHPIVGPGRVQYALGRRYYIFITPAKRWVVLEIPEGIDATPVFGPGGSITYEHDSHIYTFNFKTSKWDDFDTRTILDAPEDQDNAKPKPGSSP